MKKRIFGIGLVSIFLLAIFANVNAFGMYETNGENNGTLIVRIKINPEELFQEKYGKGAKIELKDSSGELIEPDHDFGLQAQYRDINSGFYTIKTSGDKLREKSRTVYVNSGSVTTKIINYSILDVTESTAKGCLVSSNFVELLSLIFQRFSFT